MEVARTWIAPIAAMVSITAHIGVFMCQKGIPLVGTGRTTIRRT